MDASTVLSMAIKPRFPFGSLKTMRRLRDGGGRWARRSPSSPSKRSFRQMPTFSSADFSADGANSAKPTG